jgi:accessory gene regulator B
MKNITHLWTNYLIGKGIIKNEIADVCAYGFEMIFAAILDIFIVIFIGIVFHLLVEAIVFLGFFVVFRRFTGGFHANTHLKCKISFIIVITSVLSLINVLPKNLVFNIFIPVYILQFLLIYKYVPVENLNKPLDNHKKRRNKINSFLANLFSLSLFIVLSLAENSRMASLFLLT